MEGQRMYCFVLLICLGGGVYLAGPQSCPGHLRFARYGPFCLKFVYDKMTFPEASRYCSRTGSSLPSIHDHEESGYFEDFLRTKNVYKEKLWIALKNLEHHWEWIDNTTATYFEWKNAKNERKEGKMEQKRQKDLRKGKECVVKNRNKWQLDKCDKRYYFVCALQDPLCQAFIPHDDKLRIFGADYSDISNSPGYLNGTTFGELTCISGYKIDKARATCSCTEDGCSWDEPVCTNQDDLCGDVPYVHGEGALGGSLTRRRTDLVGCCANCRANSRCMAFTYYKKNRYCFLRKSFTGFSATGLVNPKLNPVGWKKV